jgi:serine/threonine protein kinase/Tfp pilus assembly protein PilF
MNAPLNSAKSIFLNAAELPTRAQRQAYLEAHCGGDAALRREVEDLLRHFGEMASFLEPPRPDPVATAEEMQSTEGPGTVIGPYKLLEQIGEGGFGVVFMAEQQHPVRRKVALKVLKPGMDSKQVVARFEAERQALALMDHPNIAKVLDGGTIPSPSPLGGEGWGEGAGRPYFVMDLVKGLPITDYCDQAQLNTRERLELFVSVCQAVQHAHQKGVIHRDLKPSNVLVTVQDGAPLAKVIDFGIAKALGQQLTDKTLFTGFAQLVGTPLYMSPEQAALSNADVDTRSDVYSLGVLLYELLTGTTPVDKERLQEVNYDELRRIIREEEPPRPSTRISTLGRAVTTVSTNRRSDPKQLSRLFRGELDWIVMKALEKDRNRRYESASAFAADVQRYLADEPVLACPPSASYRLRKFLRRHQGPVLAASAIVFLLVTATVGISIGLVWALEAERQTRTERDAKDEARRQAVAAAKVEAEARRQARQALNTLTDEVIKDLLGKQPYLTEKHREFLKQILALHTEYARANADDPESRYSRAEGFYHVGQIQRTLGETKEAETAFRKSQSILRALVAQYDDRDDYRHSLVLCSQEIGWVLTVYKLHGAGVMPAKQAADAFREAADHARVLVGRTREVKYRSELTTSEHDLAYQLFYADQDKEAEWLFRDALAIDRALADQFPDSIEYRSAVASQYEALGHVLNATNRHPEATKAQRAALETYGKLVHLCRNPFDEELGTTYASMGVLHVELNERREAEKAFHQAVTIGRQVAKEFPARPGPRIILAMTLNNLGMLLHDLRKDADADKALRECLELRQKLAKELPRDPDVRYGLQETYHNLCALMYDAKRLKEAESLWEQGLHVGEELVKEFANNPWYRRSLGIHHDIRAQYFFTNDQFEEAEQTWRRALDQYNHIGTPKVTTKDGHQERVDKFKVVCRYNLSAAVRKTGRLEAAKSEYREAFTNLQDEADAHFEVAEALSPNRMDEAIAEYQEALRCRPDFPEAHANLGDRLRDKHLLDEAMDHYKAAIETKQFFLEAYKAYNKLGVAYMEKDHLKDAIDAYQESMRLNPDYPEAHYNYGNALFKMKRLDEAIMQYNVAIESKLPDVHQAYFALGIGFRTMGQLDKAIDAYNEAIRVNPNYAEAYTNRGNCFANQGRPARAEADYRESIRLKKDNSETYNCLGSLLANQNKLEEAEVEYRRAIRIKKDFAIAHYNLGVALIKMGRLDGAIAELSEATRIRKDYGEAYYFLGIALSDKGNLVDAIAAYRHAIQSNNGLAEAHCNLGHALRRQGKFRDALKAFRCGQELRLKYPDWPYRSAAAEWVRECERLVELDEKVFDFIDGRRTPGSPSERIELARLCSLKQFNAAAFRFYETAFIAEPQLADKPRAGHRYNAACAGALAGCGQGKDVDKLDARQRDRLRQKALDWLRADLDAWGRLLNKEPDKARPAVVQQMRHWQADADFGGVRGPQALSQLPEAERKLWHKFWEDVDNTLARAHAKTTPEKKAGAK